LTHGGSLRITSAGPRPAAVEPQDFFDLHLFTAFQFANMAGVGVQFGGRQQYQAGYRFQHVSNGGIKEPNPGINFHQLYLQYNC
jgi:hypothetical protein